MERYITLVDAETALYQYQGTDYQAQIEPNDDPIPSVSITISFDSIEERDDFIRVFTWE